MVNVVVVAEKQSAAKLLASVLYIIDREDVCQDTKKFVEKVDLNGMSSYEEIANMVKKHERRGGFGEYSREKVLHQEPEHYC